MALNFGLLDPDMPAKIAGSVYAGQQQRMQNELAQQQAAMRQQEFGMRQQEFAGQQEDRRLAKARSAENQKFLTDFSTLAEKNGHKLDRPMLGQLQIFGLKTGNESLVQLAIKGMQALDEQEGYDADMVRFGLAPPKATAAPTNALAPAAAPFEGEVTNTLNVASTPVASRPMPVANALAAPGAAPAPAPATGQINQAMVQQMILSKNPLTRAQGAALERTLPKEPATPAAIGEYQAYKAMSPAEQAAYVAHRKSLQPTPAQVSVKLPEQEKAEQGARGKLLVEEYKGISDSAKLAVKTLPAIETQERILDNGFKTGFGTEAKKAAASLLSALKVPEATQYATDAQTFLAATQNTVLQKQLEQRGPATEADSQRVTQTGAQLGNTPEANKFIISVAKAQLKRDIEQRNFYDKWWKTNNTYDGAEDAWFAGEGGKSLFERPELKKYVTKESAAAQIPTNQPSSAPAVVPAKTKSGATASNW